MLNKFKFLIILLISISNSYGQSGFVLKKLCPDVPTNELPSKYSNWQKYVNGKLYMAFPEYDSVFIIYKWDGVIWTKLPELNLMDENNGYVFDYPEEYNGELYLCVSSWKLNDIQRKGSRIYITKFDGEKWDTLPSYPDIKIESCYFLKSFKNKLYYTATIYKAGDYGTCALFCLDSAGKTTMIAKCNRASSSAISTLEVSGKYLAIGGDFDSLNGNYVPGLAFYDGIKIIPGNTFNPSCYRTFYKRNDSQILIEDCDNLELWQNDSMILNIGLPIKTSMYGFRGYTFYNNFIFTTQINHWSGYYYYDLILKKWVYVPSSSLEAQITPINAGQNKSAFFNPFPDPVQILELVPGTLFKGKMFADQNSNCSFDANDIPLKSTIFKFNGTINNTQSITDSSGNYEVYLDPDNYQIKLSIPDSKATISTCINDKVNTIKGNTYKIDLPVILTKSRNLGVKISSGSGFRARMGFTEMYDITCINYSGKPDSAIVRLEFPSKLSLDYSSLTPLKIDSNFVEFKLLNIAPTERKDIRLYFKTSVSKSKLGDSLAFIARLVTNQGDEIQENNQDTLIQKVVAAIDPNEKHSNPENEIEFSPNKIKYIVHFQNTGNDTAYNISILDTISATLDLSSFQISGSSHYKNLSIRFEKDRTIVFDFKNILLPDSHINEKLSHGYIQFEISALNQLKINDSITNKAYIYFDYQKPVLTNKTSILRIEQTVGLTENIFKDKNEFIRIIPNPTNSHFSISTSKLNAGHQGKIINSEGKEVLLFTLDNYGNHIFDYAFLNQGIYFIKIEGSVSYATLCILK